MKEDKLKSFIQNNLESFEDESPRARVWEEIEKEVITKKKTKVIPLKRVVGLVASIVLIFSCALWWMQNDQNDSLAEDKMESDLNLASFSSDFVEVENYYITEVDLKLKELTHYEVDEDILIEIDFLKEEFDQLKKEIKKSVDPQLIVEAMIDNYRLRLEILEDLLEELEEQNKKFKSKKIEQDEMA